MQLPLNKSVKLHSLKYLIFSYVIFDIEIIDVRIVEGNRGNIKVTTPEDYIDLLARFSAEDQKQIFQLYYPKANLVLPF